MTGAKRHEIRVISVHQPFAWLIVNGIKDVENRKNPPFAQRVGKRVHIHASQKRVTLKDFESFKLQMKQLGVSGAPKSIEDFHYGAIVGSAVISGFSRNSKSRWAIGGKCHWLLQAARKMRPKKIKGQQCLFWRIALRK